MSAQVLSQLNDPPTTIKEESSSSSSVTSSGSDLALLRPPKLSRAVNGTEDLQGERVHDEISSPSSPVIVYRTNSVSSNCSRDSVVTLKHYDCLLGELRCPGCARPMQSPIYLCKSGHSVCELCTETLCNCPLCKQSFTEIRSVTLEALAEKAYFLCKYSVYGCTVRLPYHLMRWHKERCVYQVGDCFMGKVWGGCKWSGCEIDWIKHCTDFHSEKLFASNEALLYWRYTPKKAKSVLGFFIFQAFGETFNLYHVHDKLRAHSKWTIVCASKDEKAYKNFAFQVELFVPGDPSRLLIQRHCCHGERDDDVLEEARCVCIGMGDIMRFMSADKTLNYRVKILDIREMQLEEMSTVAVIRSEEEINENPLPTKCLRTQDDIPVNECTNHKRVPNENIIKRRSDLRNMIATIDEEFSCCDEPAEDNNNNNRATVNTNGPIVVHDHTGKDTSTSVYSVIAGDDRKKTTSNGIDKPDPEEEHPEEKDEEQEEMRPKAQLRKNSKSNLLKDFGGYDSVKRIFQKTMSMDRMAASKVQKPPRKFLTLTPNRKSSAASGESEFEDSVSLKERRFSDSYSLPDKIPTTPPPKKTTNKRASSFINLMRSNLKF